MTIPTREEALSDVSLLVGAISNGDIFKVVDIQNAAKRLRSYIESHTGEVVGYTGSGSLAALSKGADGYMWPSPAAAHPIPLYTTPQVAENADPIKLEWVGTDGNNLSINGKILGSIDYSKNNGGWYIMTWAPLESDLNKGGYMPLETARANLEGAARQWLSIGDK